MIIICIINIIWAYYIWLIKATLGGRHTCYLHLVRELMNRELSNFPAFVFWACDNSTHRLGDLYNSHLFPHNSESCNVKIKVPTDSVWGEALFLRWKMAAFLQHPQMLLVLWRGSRGQGNFLVSLLLQIPIVLDQGLNLMTSLKVTSVEVPLSNTARLGVTASTHEFWWNTLSP